MGFRGEPFAFDSPAAAVAGMIAQIACPAAGRAVEVVDLVDAAGLILAEVVGADRDNPAFDYSSMDGYAVCVSSLSAKPPASGEDGITVPVVGESRIGCAPPVLHSSLPGPAAVRIATGAPIPLGADAVLRREDVHEHTAATPGQVGSIRISLHAAARVKPGDYIRRRGENARAGTPVLHAGEVLTASSLGALAAVGVAHPRVYRRLRIAVLTTGDELVAPGESPAPYQIRDSNGPSVRAMLASQAWASVVAVTHVADDARLEHLLKRACEDADAVILTGGISVGHRDPVRAAAELVGGRIIFHGLPQRPGKPMMGAVVERAGAPNFAPIPIFGLPGNPVSALVTCTRIVLPVLAACAGARKTPISSLPRMLELTNPDDRTLELWWHRLARLILGADGLPRAELVDGRGSGDIIAAATSDGFIEVPPGASGRTFSFYSWPAGN